MLRGNRGNWSLIGLLAAAVIVVVLAAMYFGGSFTTVSSNNPGLEKNTGKTTVVGQSIDAAKDLQCKEQLDQCRKGLEAYKATNGSDANPPDLKEVTAGFGAATMCPISGQAYNYDPMAGQIRCAYVPHVKY